MFEGVVMSLVVQKCLCFHNALVFHFNSILVALVQWWNVRMVLMDFGDPTAVMRL